MAAHLILNPNPTLTQRRPEMKFNSLDQLIARIQADIGVASAALDVPGHVRMRDDPFLTL